MYCPSCGEEIAEESAFCRYCGNDTQTTEGASFNSEKSEAIAESTAVQTGRQWEPGQRQREGEQVLKTYKANRTKSEGRAVGGKLFLTDQRLLFEPGSVDSKTGAEKVSIDLDNITKVSTESSGGRGLKDTLFGGGMRDRLRIGINDQTAELFVVSKLSKVKDEIKTIIQGGRINPEESGTSLIKKLGYWGGRIVQIILIGLAVIFVGGGLSMNVIQFAALGIFALVLLGFAGFIEVLIVRPSKR